MLVLSVTSVVSVESAVLVVSVVPGFCVARKLEFLTRGCHRFPTRSLRVPDLHVEVPDSPLTPGAGNGGGGGRDGRGDGGGDGGGGGGDGGGGGGGQLVVAAAWLRLQRCREKAQPCSELFYIEHAGS